MLSFRAQRGISLCFEGHRETKNQSEIPRCAVESHVSPAKAGIQFRPDMDPRSPAFAEDKLRGGDVLTFIFLGGPQAHVHSE